MPATATFWAKQPAIILIHKKLHKAGKMEAHSNADDTHLETAPCGVCGGTSFNHLFRASDYIYGNPGSWPVAQCKHCGVVLLMPRIPPPNIGPYYPKTYYTNTRKQSDVSTFRNRLKFHLIREKYGYPPQPNTSIFVRVAAAIMRPFVSRLASFQHNISYVRHGRVLDVGCGSGWCLDNYKTLGWATHGIEMGAESAEVARKGGHDIYLGELREARYLDNTFDAVTLWDTLEHVYNPAETLKELCRICKPGGRIYTYVPNYGSTYARRFRDRWFMFTAPLHYYHYTSETLTYLLTTSGLTIENIQYPLGGAGIQPTLAAMYSWNRLLGSIVSHRLTRTILQILDQVMPRGHLLVVARKPE